MNYVTPKHGVNLSDWEAATAEKKGFQMPPLLSSYRIGAIYTISLKMVELDHFRPNSVKLGEMSQ